MNVATEQITSLFIGEQGIKTIMAGSVPIYERPGGYVYLTLKSDQQTQTDKIQNEKE